MITLIFSLACIPIVQNTAGEFALNFGVTRTWVPGLGIAFNMHLIMGLPTSALYRLLVWTVCISILLFIWDKDSTLEKLEGYETVKSESPMQEEVPATVPMPGKKWRF